MSDRDRDRDERRRRVVGAGGWAADGGTGDRQAYTIPRGIPLFRPKEKGAYRIEVLPYEQSKRMLAFAGKKYGEPGDLFFVRTFYVHGGVGVNNDTYTCPAKTYGNPCPICEERQRLDRQNRSSRTPDKETEDMIKGLLPRTRQLYLIVDCDDEDRGVQLWDVSYGNFGKQLENKINNAEPEDKPRYEMFYHPDDGYTLKLDAVEEKFSRTTYLEFSVDSFRERRRPLPQEWLDHGICLDDVVREPSYDELKKAFFGADDEGGRDEPGGRRGDRDEGRRSSREPEPRGRGRESEDTRGGSTGNAREPEPARRTREPEPAAKAPDIRVGDTVEWTYRDKTWTGEVVKVDADKGVASMKVEGRDRDMVEDLDRLRVVDAPAAKSRDKEPEPEPRGRGREPEPEPARRAETARGGSGDGWDDDRPSKRETDKPADREPEPEPRGRGRASDNDDPPPRRRR